VKASRSSSLADALETETVPVVDITSRPSDRSSKASTSAADAVRPTSEPSKYMENAPAVVAPSEVASKRTTSESSIGPVIPGKMLLRSASTERSSESESSHANASIR
jgi:hypothetical protein